MAVQRIVRRSVIPAPPAAVFAWHARPGALARLSPPWDPVEILERRGGLEPGSRVVLRFRVGGLPVRWVAEHRDLEPGRSFTDVQVEGPFRTWRHVHRFLPDPGGCLLEDDIAFEAPPGIPVSWILGHLETVFAHRHRTTLEDLLAHAAFAGGPLRVVVTGASGLLGGALLPFLEGGGHQTVPLRRGPGWDPMAARADPAAFAGADAVVHLAGENIAAGRWTPALKARIRDSRVRGTEALARALGALPSPPRVLVCASAVGYYGDRGSERLDETRPPGQGFLPETCVAWEAAADPARARGIRVVHLRFGIILTPAGGALARMRLPFRLGLGGPIGSGRQPWSWITLDDAIGAVHHALGCEALSGPVNATAGALPQAEFAKALGRALGRPALLPMPAFAARAAFGEMADALFLAGADAPPRRLRETGYRFRDPDLDTALHALFGRGVPPHSP